MAAAASPSAASLTNPGASRPPRSALPRGAKAVAEALLAGAKPTHDNAFKVTLVERTLGAVLAHAKAVQS